AKLVETAFVLKNVICESFDPNYAEFSRCEMKIVKRGVAAFFMYCRVHQLPVTNVHINVALYKKSNGYRPFLFNQTLDYCYYMRNPEAHPLIYTLHKTFIARTNMNHTCPYDASTQHDLSIDNLVYKEDDLKDIPIPKGDYMIRISIKTQNIWRGHFSICI
ncbi:hypothetical protein KR018_009836, partial [Drosophila ironensis]